MTKLKRNEVHRVKRLGKIKVILIVVHMNVRDTTLIVSLYM